MYVTHECQKQQERSKCPISLTTCCMITTKEKEVKEKESEDVRGKGQTDAA